MTKQMTFDLWGRREENRLRSLGPPDWEMGNLDQMELLGRWVDNGEADGLPCQIYPLPYLVRLFDEQERRIDRWIGQGNFLFFALPPGDNFSEWAVERQRESQQRRGFRPPPLIEPIDPLPDGSAHFPECNGVRNLVSLEEASGYGYLE